jgi:hypothetical protein
MSASSAGAVRSQKHSTCINLRQQPFLELLLLPLCNMLRILVMTDALTHSSSLQAVVSYSSMCSYLWCVAIKWVYTLSTVFEQLSSFSDVRCQPSWVLLITLLCLLTL